MTPLPPLKIVHIDTSLEVRGGQYQLLQLALRLRRRGHAQTLVCREGSELETRLREEGLACFPLPAHDPAHAYGILQLRKFLREGRCDIVHAHDGRAQTVAWLASVGTRARRVASRRVGFLPRPIWTYRLKYSSTCDAVIAVSDYIRRRALGCGVPDSRIEVIPDGIEIPAELPARETAALARAAWGFSDRHFLVGHLGAFAPEKGQEVALGALRRLGERLPEARLLLAGEGPRRRAAEIAVEREGMGGRVRFCGRVQNPAGFFPALDLFIMPSKSEGLGSAALLAMSYGLPVVASRVGGLPEIVLENSTGWLVEPGSEEALAQAIAAAAGDRAELQEMGRKARQRARQYSLDIMVERTEALYGRLVEGK
jgi:glycosyltransferase involved in cell wall biosynthesis